jgi:REP element-mobilizing transposase RayT
MFPPNLLEYGGISRKGRRKIRRPFDPKRAMHLVMRASRARGAWSFLHRRNKAHVYALLLDLCERYSVKLYGFENVGNHLHLIVKFPSRWELKAFLRVFAQRLMFLITGARKGDPKGRFFDAIAYTRVVNWGRDFRVLKSYLWKNALESLGFSRDQVQRYRRIAKLMPD